MIFKSPHEYQPMAHQIFLDIRAVLHRSLQCAKVEHIGSSSIKGAISKGDLDIYVTVPKGDISNAISLFENMGFHIKQDTLRTDALCMLETNSYDIDVAIQVIESGSEYENFLWFRNRLNSDPNLIVEYHNLKKSCEGLTAAQYRTRKSEFIDRVPGNKSE